MVEQTHPGSAGYVTPARTPVPILTIEERDARFRGRLLVVFVACLFVPGVFSIAGSQLSPYRVVLLAIFPWLLWRWLTTRPCLVDFLVLASAGWTVLALVKSHGLGIGPRAVISFVELFGGYLVGRILITDAREFKRYFVVLGLGFAVIAPFALLEMATGFNTFRTIFGLVFGIPARQHNLGLRLGLVRAQGTLEHPILWGLVASLGVANGFYIWRRNLVKAFGASGFFAFMVGTSLSSGPLLGVLAQICLMAWDRLFFFMRFRWVVLGFLALFALLLLKILAQFHLLDFVLGNLTFSKTSADGRLVVLDYGMMEVTRHPVFGIGLNDWTRPWYRAGKASFDNFWLLEAMRYGIPTFAFLALAWAASMLRIATQRTLSPEEQDYRRGYLIALSGLTIVLGTVYIWNATCIFVWIYLGAGAWFYMSKAPQETRDAATLARRAAQGRGGAPGAPPGAPSRAPSGAPSGTGGQGAAGRNADGRSADGRSADGRDTAGRDTGGGRAAAPARPDPRARAGAPAAIRGTGGARRRRDGTTEGVPG